MSKDAIFYISIPEPRRILCSTGIWRVPRDSFSVFSTLKMNSSQASGSASGKL